MPHRYVDPCIALQHAAGDRLLTSDVAQRFFTEVNVRAKKFMSDEQFTVDGTLIQAWVS